MTEKRFVLNNIVEKGTVSFWDNEKETILNASHSLDLLNKLAEENEQLKFENENLKISIEARDVKIEVCEKKFRELGFIITVDDDGYVIE